MASLQEMKAQNSGKNQQAIDRTKHPILGKTDYIEKRKNLLGAGMPQHMTVEREMRTATIMLMQSKDLQDASAESFYQALSVAINSGIGLGAGRGYLVAYKGRVSFVPGWKGIVDLISRTGRATVWTGVVHRGDHFEYALGDSPYCKHVPGDNDNPKDITHYYAVGRVKNSEWPIVEVWSMAKVIKHLNLYNRQSNKHYALKDDVNMEMYGRKVVLLQAAKYLPQSQDLDNAMAADIAAETGKNMTIDGQFMFVNENEEPAGTHSLENNPAPTMPMRSSQPEQDAMPISQHDEQNEIRQQATQPAGPVLDEADKIEQNIRRANDVDVLDVAADLIGTVDDLLRRSELTDLYRARRAELSGDVAEPAAPAQQQQQAQPNAQRATRGNRGGMSLE